MAVHDTHLNERYDDTHPNERYDDVYVDTVRVPVKRISWSAVFAGVIISMVIYMLLVLLGIAIGASTIDPLKEQNPIDGLGKGAAIWTGISMLISIAAGGYFSGRLAPREGALHGVLMFGVNTLVSTVIFSMIASSAVTGAANIMGAGLKAVGSGIGAVAPQAVQLAKDELNKNNINLDSMKNELQTTLRQTGKPELQPEQLQQTANNEVDNAQQQAAATANNPQQADQDLSGFINGLIARNQNTFQAADRDALKNIIKARTGKTDAEAEQVVNQAEKSYQAARAKYEELKQQAEQKAREAADKAAAATSKAAWFTLILLIVEAIVAGATGMVGRRKQPVARVSTTTGRV